ncbi:MAG: HAD-IC family P-type ATPase, partial [Parvibaculum sp.]|nr:HAD-IC family P-type ATPase [Parvibaculum sp.]
MAVRITHDAVPGRARFEVAGLYRSHVVKARLEHGLADDPSIRRLRADIRTGRLLLEFDEALETSAMMGRVEKILAGEAPGLAAKAPTSKAGPDEASVVNPRPDAPWLRNGADVLAGLQSERAGLTAAEAAARLASHGPNEVPVAHARSELAMLLDQFKTLPVAMLGGSALVSLATGSPLDALMTLGVVGANGGIGYAMERGAEKTIHDITGHGAHRVLVRRDGIVHDIAPRELVPGDILVLTPGSFIDADARILEAIGLSVDESSLTGGSVPVAKHAQVLADPHASLSERANCVFRGTIVDGGSGLGVVVATGAGTEIGRVQALTGEARPPQTHIERELERMGRHLVYLSLAVSGGIFALGVARGLGPLPMLKSAVALAVAAMPEGLPAVATSTLALGLSELKKKNVLVRKLDAVEGLGSLNVLCFDKTGTLTLNRMTVDSLFVGSRAIPLSTDGFGTEDGHADLQRHEMKKFLEVAALCSEVKIEETGDVPLFHGSPTEVALVDLALRGGVDVSAVRADNPADCVIYRTEERKFMVSRHHRLSEEKISLAVKGSPDQVLQRCRMMEVDGALAVLSPADRAAILDENERLAGEGLRVLGLAYSHDGEAA